MRRSLVILALAVGLLLGPPAHAAVTPNTASYSCTSTSSTAIAPVNGFRKAFQWQNNGSVAEVVAVGTNNQCNASQPNGYVLQPGMVWKLPDGSEAVPTGDISCCTAGGTGVLSGQEW